MNKIHSSLHKKVWKLYTAGIALTTTWIVCILLLWLGSWAQFPLAVVVAMWSAWLCLIIDRTERALYYFIADSHRVNTKLLLWMGILLPLLSFPATMLFFAGNNGLLYIIITAPCWLLMAYVHYYKVMKDIGAVGAIVNETI